MMKFAVAALAATFVVAGVAAESQAKSRTGRNIAIGVGAALVTGLIISESARARGRDYYSTDDHYRRCRSLMRQCDNGKGWACRKFENNC